MPILYKYARFQSYEIIYTITINVTNKNNVIFCIKVFRKGHNYDVTNKFYDTDFKSVAEFIAGG